MKWIRIALIFVIASGLLAACGSTASDDNAPADDQQTVGETTAPATLSEDYEDALTIKNQLLLGTLRLEGTAQAITAEQAPSMIPLWQAFAALSASGTAATEETEAVQNQIMAAMTPEQVAGIAAMQLTNADLQAYYVEVGLTVVKTPEPGVTPQSTGMKDLSQEDKEATRVASGQEPTGSGSGKSSALLDMVLDVLAGK